MSKPTHPGDDVFFGADRQAPPPNSADEAKQARLKAFEVRLKRESEARARREVAEAETRESAHAARVERQRRSHEQEQRASREAAALERVTERERREQDLLEQDDDFARFRAQRMGKLDVDPPQPEEEPDAYFGATPLGGAATQVGLSAHAESPCHFDVGNHRMRGLEARLATRLAEGRRKLEAERLRAQEDQRVQEEERRRRLREGLERGLQASRRDRLRQLEDEAAASSAGLARLEDQDEFARYRRERLGRERKRRHTTSRRRRAMAKVSTRRVRRRLPKESEH